MVVFSILAQGLTVHRLLAHYGIGDIRRSNGTSRDAWCGPSRRDQFGCRIATRDKQGLSA
jgi:hypothetical protein